MGCGDDKCSCGFTKYEEDFENMRKIVLGNGHPEKSLPALVEALSTKVSGMWKIGLWLTAAVSTLAGTVAAQVILKIINGGHP